MAISVDAVQATILVGGHPRSSGRLSDYRFEGFTHPGAYLDEGGQLLTLRSRWTETPSDVLAALSWLRTNRSRHGRVVRRKASRFGHGSLFESSPKVPGYFRNVALNASVWLRRLQDTGVTLAGSYINLGAANGVGDDPLYEFATQEVRSLGGPTLAVEANQALCAKHREALPWVTLACERVSTRNLGDLVRRTFTTEAATNLDVLKVDIDSFEGPLLEEALLRLRLRPKLLFVEVNAGIPPPLQFALLDSPLLERYYPELAISSGGSAPMEVNMPCAGASLSYLVRHLAPEYSLLELGSPDAIFVRSDLLPSLGRRAPQDEFQAFARSWVDVHGFSRGQLRRWFFELDEVEALGEVHEHLSTWMQRHLGVVLPFVLSF